MLERGSSDPVKFAYDFLGIDLHPAQAKFLQNSVKPGIKEANLSAGNRFGKGEAIAVKSIWMPFYQKRNPKFAFDAQGQLREYTAINVSISLDQASIVFNKAAGYAQNSPRLAEYITNVKYSPFPELTFRPVKGSKRGAELWARSTAFGAKYLLGQNFQYLNFDEASLESNGDIIMNDVIRMRMADSGGTIDTTSQPRGKNWFYHHFLRGLPESVVYDNACYSQYGSSFDNPHIDHEHIKRSMEYMSIDQIQENIYGQFTDKNQFFAADRIQNCYRDQEYALPVPYHYDVIQKTRNGASYAELKANPNSDAKYVIGIDLANRHDQTCIVLLRIDTTPWTMVYFELLNKMDWRLIKERIVKVYNDYHAWGYIDSTGAGEPIFSSLVSDYQIDVEGYTFTEASKTTLLYELQMAIQNREFIFPYNGAREGEGTKELVDQLTNYQQKDKHLRTDAVFGLALAVKAARDALNQDVIPVIESPDAPLVIARRNVRTGSYFFSTIDDEDENYDRYLGRWKNLID